MPQIVIFYSSYLILNIKDLVFKRIYINFETISKNTFSKIKYNISNEKINIHFVNYFSVFTKRSS